MVFDLYFHALILVGFRRFFDFLCVGMIQGLADFVFSVVFFVVFWVIDVLVVLVWGLLDFVCLDICCLVMTILLFSFLVWSLVLFVLLCLRVRFCGF